MTSTANDDFFVKLNQTIEEANKKQTLELKKEIESVRESIQEESKKRTELEEKYKILKVKYTQLEKSLRKNNIIIFGLENVEEKLSDYVIKTLNTYLSLNLVHKDINDVFTIGKQPSTKPIIVKLVSHLQKKEILRNCFKLKEINKNRDKKIIITEELSPDEIKTQKVLRKHLNKARSRNYFAYIKGEKIYINGNAYTAEELEQEVININEVETEEEIEDKVTSVWGSNSAPSTPIVIRRKNSETAESIIETGNFQKKSKTTTGAPTVKTRTTTRKQEEKNKKIETPDEKKIGPNKNRNREEDGSKK